MSDNDIKLIFSRFWNLNLLCLMEDLEWDNVACGDWFEDEEGHGKSLCPLAHGWDKWSYMENAHVDTEYEHVGLLPNEFDLGGDFINWFDGVDTIESLELRKQRLLDVLVDIYQERLADADAVQGVLNEQYVAYNTMTPMVDCWQTADIGGEA